MPPLGTVSGPAGERSRQEHAARLIQARFRGYMARKAFLKLQKAAPKLQAVIRGWYTRRKVDEERQRVALDQRYQRVMNLHHGRIQALETERHLVLAQPATELPAWDAKREAAATKVAAAFRGMMQRKKWAARGAERVQREMESRRLHAAFQEANKGGSRQKASGGRASTITLVPPPSARQSASVLIGSPAKSDTESSWDDQGNGSGSAWPRDMSSKRYLDLSKQVDASVAAYKAMAKHRRQDTQQVDARLKDLLQEHRTSAVERLRALSARQQQLQVSEVLAGQLEGAVPPSQLQDPQPQDFPRPPQGSERWERAVQSHALALADARVGSQWWRHLRMLNREDLQEALQAEDEEHWKTVESMWRARWVRMQAQEEQRPDPLEHKKKAGPGWRRLSEIAEWDRGPTGDCGADQHSGLAHEGCAA